jgi:hypothetical protein
MTHHVATTTLRLATLRFMPLAAIGYVAALVCFSLQPTHAQSVTVRHSFTVYGRSTVWVSMQSGVCSADDTLGQQGESAAFLLMMSRNLARQPVATVSTLLPPFILLLSMLLELRLGCFKALVGVHWQHRWKHEPFANVVTIASVTMHAWLVAVVSISCTAHRPHRPYAPSHAPS